MSEFAAVDPILARWAERHGFKWDDQYQDIEVRSLGWPLRGNESIQIWIDPPSAGGVTVNIAHNSSVDGRRRSMKAVHKLDDLEVGLDDALASAMEWRTEALA